MDGAFGRDAAGTSPEKGHRRSNTVMGHTPWGGQSSDQATVVGRLAVGRSLPGTDNSPE